MQVNITNFKEEFDQIKKLCVLQSFCTAYGYNTNGLKRSTVNALTSLFIAQGTIEVHKMKERLVLKQVFSP